MPEFLESELYGNELTDWGLAALLTAGVLALALVAKLVLLHRLPAAAPTDELRWPTVLYELVQRTSTLFLIISAVYAGTTFLTLPEAFHRLVFSVFIVALFIQIALWADRLARALLIWRLAPVKTKTAMRNALTLIEFFVRVAVWSVALLLIFENLGFDVTALVAGLGIGGIAVALAAQSVLGDLFSSLAIVLDRPFEVGDFIAFGDQKGTVERIGIKTTRIRSLSGEQISCSNTDLMNSRVHNYKRMAERRVLFVVGAAYETPQAKLEKIPAFIREIIEAQELTRFERAHFRSFGDSALEFETVYWVLSPDQSTYMDIQQAINFAIFRAFEQESIDFAFPSQTIYMPELKEALGTIVARQ
ncbi:MAG: mechanosensitive ion channel family protein [Methyloceanibacter sp.]|uniref:mechanosensitive ion channel family protein n=1 Tax=Methyloceanibacter sp. TaxID=1965321 RepID=UPI003D6D16EF